MNSLQKCHDQICYNGYTQTNRKAQQILISIQETPELTENWEVLWGI